MTLEERAEEYANNIRFVYETDVMQKVAKMYAKQAYIAGAKDNNVPTKWHFVKDGDLPKHENYVLVSNGKDWTKGFYKDKKWNVIHLVGFIKIIAWKEIVLPELPTER